MNKFQKDLIVGQTNEQLISNILTKKGYKVEPNTSKIYEELQKWDLQITGKTNNVIQLEVKQDFKSQYTNNVAIELKCVNNTTSDFFVYNIGYRGIYIIHIEKLKYLLTDNIPGFFTYGGDNNNSYMKIISADTFIQNSTVLLHQTKEGKPIKTIQKII